MRTAIRLFAFVLVFATTVCAQSPNATVNGQVLDTSGGLIADATVEVINEATNVSSSTKTNSSGIYLVPDLPPATYRIQVSHLGFKTIVKPDVILNVRDAVEINFTLPIGAISEMVTVEGGAPLINTQDAAVSTVVDRQFAENLPMNGRSFQTLIELTPGVVLTSTGNGVDTGQFSVNGQRPSSNYWMVDGVSANIGISSSATPGNGLAGALGSYSALGGTNSLVSVDALQEFRIQTSTFAPEFGRTPGAQISIVTRSGTNGFHGTGFDYIRNDLFDANDWFADKEHLPKPRERQNDFGGTLAGPIAKDRTFFFFSYEGLRLRLPQTLLTNVPDANARRNATAAMQPYLNAYPLPNGTDNTTTGVAQFNASFSNPASLNAYSLRIDHRLTDTLNLFGRYSYSPSELDQRGSGVASLSTVSAIRITTQTATIGTTWTIAPTLVNDFRFNYSSTDAHSWLYLDNFGGAIPLTSISFPSSYTDQNALFTFVILGLGSNNEAFVDGANTHNRQKQVNTVDSLSLQKGTHSLKFGMDFRRLSPEFNPRDYLQEPLFLSVSGAETGNPIEIALQSARNATFLLRNLGLFVQDTWRLVPRLTVTYGLRWDVDFAPSTISGPSLNAVTGFNFNNLSSLSLAPAGTPTYETKYGNVAPRIGISYELFQSQRWQRVVRAGFGVFYDLATSELGNNIPPNEYPLGASNATVGGTFPASSPAQTAPPTIVAPNATNGEILYGFDPGLQLPYTLEWNAAIDQALGAQQTLSVSYVGSVGRRLLETAAIQNPNANYGEVSLVTNAATSDYDALQLQLQRRLSGGLQVLASFTWAHSIDTASAGSLGSHSNGLVVGTDPNVNRASSDFDIRHAFSMGMTYDLPLHKGHSFAEATIGGWSTENILEAWSAPPVEVYYGSLSTLSNGFFTDIRPDVTAGQPLYLYGPQYPGHKAFNPGAFTIPSAFPSGQGDMPRNFLRGFGAYQWDFAVHRDFPIRENVKLQFRAEMFNVLNHPNFGPPNGNLGSPPPAAPSSQFGLSTQMLGQSLNGQFGTGAGGFSPLYQIGGPRSVQFALKLFF